MELADHSLSLAHGALAEALASGRHCLLVQDLDGVCMALVRDPLRRTLEARYVEASRAFDGHFFVLTNGEHVGKRGVNGLVDAAFGDPARARAEGLYLPGAAAGGVQLQDARGRVTHPGVSEAELTFLAAVPARARHRLAATLRESPFTLDAASAAALADACVLDNAVSPTVNLNTLFEHHGGDPARYRAVQHQTATFLRAELERAGEEGLGDAFFIHLAPNLGRDDAGQERLQEASGTDAGTTDFQFMLRGAVKEAGVLVLLNHYYAQHYGEHPLGKDFNVRAAPADPAGLLDLAADRFDAARMPRIVGVGDTVTALARDGDVLRGGSDRGFLTLVQSLGRHFGSDNATVFVDSSGGELRRPGIDRRALGGASRHAALAGISDAEDPLRLNFLFPGGHREYVDFFCRVAAARQAHQP